MLRQLSLSCKTYHCFSHGRQLLVYDSLIKSSQQPIGTQATQIKYFVCMKAKSPNFFKKIASLWWPQRPQQPDWWPTKPPSWFPDKGVSRAPLLPSLPSNGVHGSWWWWWRFCIGWQRSGSQRAAGCPAGSSCCCLLVLNWVKRLLKNLTILPSGWLLSTLARLGQKTVEKIRPSFPQADFLALLLTWVKRLLRKSNHSSLRLTS